MTPLRRIQIHPFVGKPMPRNLDPSCNHARCTSGMLPGSCHVSSDWIMGHRSRAPLGILACCCFASTPHWKRRHRAGELRLSPTLPIVASQRWLMSTYLTSSAFSSAQKVSKLGDRVAILSNALCCLSVRRNSGQRRREKAAACSYYPAANAVHSCCGMVPF